MSPGVVSLRCPACGRPFLSLPQQAEALVTCPHCAQSAPMATFGPASAALANGPTVPLRRRIIQQPATAPAPTQSVPSAFLGGSLPLTPIPEQRLTFRPLSSPAGISSPFPPAPPAKPLWQPSDLAGSASSVSTAPPALSPFADSGSARPFRETRSSSQPSEEQPADEPALSDEFPDDERKTPWSLVLLLMVAFVGWVLWEHLQPPLSVTIPVVEKPTLAAEPIAPPVPEEPPVQPEPIPLQKPAEPEPEPPLEVRRAEAP